MTCRGTEPNEWNDIKADANALTDLAESLARSHRGFTREADDIWLFVEEELRSKTSGRSGSPGTRCVAQ